MKLTEWGCFKVPVNPRKRYTSPSPVQYWCILKCIFQCENADRSWWTWSALWLINICILLLSLWVLSLHSCHVKFYSKAHHNTKSSSMSAKYKTVYVLMLNTSVFVLLNYNYSAQFPCLLAIRNQVSVFMVCLWYELYVNTDYTLINHFTKCQVEPHFATFVSCFYKHFSKIWVIPTRQHHSCFRFVESPVPVTVEAVSVQVRLDQPQ